LRGDHVGLSALRAVEPAHAARCVVVVLRDARETIFGIFLNLVSVTDFVFV
jgi:hypothetical protein